MACSTGGNAGRASAKALASAREIMLGAAAGHRNLLCARY